MPSKKEEYKPSEERLEKAKIYYDVVQKESYSLKKRILNNIVKIPETDCWEWQLYTADDGYGRLTLLSDKKEYNIAAHRISYMLFKGELIDAMYVCHTCDNRLCLNPDHLFLGTPKDNIHDMIRKDRIVLMSGERNGSAKLSQEDVLEIFRLKQSGMMQKDIAELYNVQRCTISQICGGWTWCHLNLVPYRKRPKKFNP